MSALRRLFFDDGKSRKHWQILQRGKGHVVEYGRIGASSRRIRKAFGTPVEARVSAEKLVASKLKSGYTEIDPSLLEIKRPRGKTVATEKSVRAFEKQLGHSLPKEFKQFLVTQNGGRPNPAYIRVPGVPWIENVGVQVLCGLYGSEKTYGDLLWATKFYGPVLPDGHLPIAYDSDIFTLSLRGKHFGCVFFWDHETDMIDNDGKFVAAAGYLLAGSFDEFLTRIALFFDEDDRTKQQSGKGRAIQAAEARTYGRGHRTNRERD